MMGKRFAAALLCLLLCVAHAARADEARDITGECAFAASGNAKQLERLFDNDYKTRWRANTSRRGYLEIAAPEGGEIGAVYIKWKSEAPPWRVTAQKDGEWIDVAESRTGFLADYLPLPAGVSKLRVRTAKDSRATMSMLELRVYAPGEPPPDVQRWQPSWDRCDLMVLVAHPDDELLFIGGTIPYYAGELGKRVEVGYVVPTSANRRLELLDGLWLCGQRAYPLFGTMRDNFAMSLKTMYSKWSKDKLFALVTRMIRQCKPDVIVTHDVNGEYGHGAHRAVADAAKRCVEKAANPKWCAKSAKEFGVWQASKLYLHLYGKNPVTMDWRKPLDAFGGRTAFDMACEGFKAHRSQQETEYVVRDDGPYDNRLFGLYFSNVGQDVRGDDFLENIAPGEV